MIRFSVGHCKGVLWHHSCHSEWWLLSTVVGECIFSLNAAEWFSSQGEMLKLVAYGSQQFCLTFRSTVPKHGSAILDNKRNCFCDVFFLSTVVSCIFKREMLSSALKLTAYIFPMAGVSGFFQNLKDLVFSVE